MIDEICRRLDGLPLALELIAPLVRRMGLTPVHEMILADPLSVGRLRGAHLRHTGLGEAIRWTVDRLDPAALEVLDALAVFAGPARLEWLERYTGLDRGTLLRGLTVLGESSLVEHLGDRVRVLETVRSAVLALHDQPDDLFERHARLIADGIDDIEEARRALGWAINARNSAWAMALLDRFRPRIGSLGVPASLRPWLAQIAEDAPDDATRAAALDLGNTLALVQGDYRNVVRDVTAALTAIDALPGPVDRQGYAYIAAALRLALGGHRSLAMELIERAEKWNVDHQDDWISGWTMSANALLLRRAGDRVQAAGQSRAAIEIFEDLGDTQGSLLARLTLARALGDEVYDDEARRHLIDAATRAHEVGDSVMTAIAYLYRAQLSYALDSPHECATALRMLLRSARRSHNQLTVASGLEHVAGLCVRYGSAKSAARLIGFTAVHRQLDPQAPAPRHDSFAADIQRVLPEATIERNRRLGAAMSFDSVVALADAELVGVLGASVDRVANAGVASQ